MIQYENKVRRAGEWLRELAAQVQFLAQKKKKKNWGRDFLKQSLVEKNETQTAFKDTVKMKPYSEGLFD